MYYYVLIIGLKGKRSSGSGHVFECPNKKEVETIIELNPLPFLQNRTDIKISIKKLDMRYSHNKRLVKRRKEKRGGIIWKN